ncbi:MAG: hypothetical protein AAF329_11370 [Cyanobacteria bacterium P01_A01_bin.17]
MTTATGIFSIQADNQLVEMTEAPYLSEDAFQSLLEDYPSLLAGDQIDSASPRRWLLVKREMGVPDVENGYGRWSVDHLFLDQDAVPTLVEVKRSSDTRIRREVVGQMLDYAANAVSYWPMEQIRTCYEETCESKGIDAQQALAKCLGGIEPLSSEEALNAYWQRLQTNLRAGKVRMIFVADEIPTELRRIVEFLNEQMNPAEVLAVEIRQYVGEGLKTLIPKVIGQTAEAQIIKRNPVPPQQTRQWNEESFLQRLLDCNGPDAVGMAKQIIDWTKEHQKERQLEIAWGKGAKWGSFIPSVVHEGKKHQLFRAWSENYLEIHFKFLRRQSCFADFNRFNQLLEKLYDIPGIEPTKEEWREIYVRIDYAALSNGDSLGDSRNSTLDDFLLFYDWVIEQIIAA